MIAFTYYILKLCICSAILFCYYYGVLRNKQFHQWNRFYLLSAVVLSLIVPCLQFFVWQPGAGSAEAIQLLQIVYTADEFVADANTNQNSLITLNQAYWICYSLISSLFLIALVRTFQKLWSVIRSSSVSMIQSIKFINTDVKGSPFSFLKYIFWNKNIDLSSPTGQHIFQHEVVHVKEKHSLDKIFIQVVLIFFWCNPVFWLIKKELKMIHEFIADKKALGQSDESVLAAMLLQASYPNYYNSLTNQFFQSSIKRRLAMLTKQQTQKISYAGRLLALPIIAFIVFAFTIKTKNANNPDVILEKDITVVIDAGHGGNTGAKATGVIEDEIVLQIAKQIKQLNTNSKIKILLTRVNDQSIAIKDRVEFAKEKNADLFISLHANADEHMIESTNGIEVMVSSRKPFYQKDSELLGSALVKELSEVYKVHPNLVKRNSGVWVIDANVCPSVLIECGYLTNKKDREFISNRSNQKLIAQKILSAITNYAATATSQSKSVINENATTGASQSPVSFRNLKDTLDNPLVYVDGIEKGRLKALGGMEKLVNSGDIKSMSIYKEKDAINKYGAKGSEGVIELFTSKSAVPPPPSPPTPLGGINISTGQENPLVFIDGKESGKVKEDKIKKMDPALIESINVLKGQDALKKYGDKGKDGVIEITTKNKIESTTIHFSADIIHFESSKMKIDDAVLIIIDGKDMPDIKISDIEKSISPKVIKSMSIYKGQDAIDKYGLKGSNGVLEAYTYHQGEVKKSKTSAFLSY